MTLDFIKENVIIDPITKCWNWNKSLTSAGYGQFTYKKVYWLTHRYVYQLLNGPINNKLLIRHLCHNRKCCNPEHLLIGTSKDNWHDSEEIHRLSAKNRRHTWIINNKSYKTFKEAIKATGLSNSSLSKYTINGVFNTVEYRKACKIANYKPKV